LTAFQLSSHSGSDKGKPDQSQGRNATVLSSQFDSFRLTNEIAGLPQSEE